MANATSLPTWVLQLRLPGLRVRAVNAVNVVVENVVNVVAVNAEAATATVTTVENAAKGVTAVAVTVLLAHKFSLQIEERQSWLLARCLFFCVLLSLTRLLCAGLLMAACTPVAETMENPCCVTADY